MNFNSKFGVIVVRIMFFYNLQVGMQTCCKRRHMEKVIHVVWGTSKKMLILDKHEVDDSNENMFFTPPKSLTSLAHL